MTSAEVVAELWRRFDAREWERARELLADDVVFDWPHSREAIRGADRVIELNLIYPEWVSLRVEQLVADGEGVVSLVRVETPGEPAWAASFFELRDGLVHRCLELWAEEGMQATPEWRAHLVEPWRSS